MQIIPAGLVQIIQKDKNLHKAVLDIDSKIENIVKEQSPVFFPEYTGHGINHFADTLKMAYHLIDLDEEKKNKGQKAVVDYFSPLNSTILISSILLHDLGMHIHFKGFKQLINGIFDNIKVEFFDEFSWKQEWENFMIEAKRFSGRERINLFGDEQAIVKDIDFSKSTVDSDVQKNLIGEFIRRHHGRLAHEIALKGFPVQEDEVIQFAPELKHEYKDIIGVIARSHSMDVRTALNYIEEVFPADPDFPYEIEIPFLMCVLRVADYFQFDSSRTNAFIIKLKSFSSPFSFREHQAHLSTEYFKTDENDPETLFVDLKPKDGLMYTKLIKLFDDIQRELDTSFAINGEMYGRHRDYLKLRYRRIRTNLKNRKVVNMLPYVAEAFRFEADTDLFKLLVGPLYGYDPSYGVRELIQNAIDACIELEFKHDGSYVPEIEICIDESDDQYTFSICDNGKGMSIGEIKNYFLKAGASFRNSIEWKIDYQTEENTPAIRRTGKFGIGVLASFLIGDSIEVTTRRYNNNIGYTFSADLKNEFIEVRKNEICGVGTNIVIKMEKDTYDDFKNKREKLTRWYVLSYPPIKYFIDNEEVKNPQAETIELANNKQKLTDSIVLEFENFENIIWSYSIKQDIAINGILIPSKYYYPSVRNYGEPQKKEKNIYDDLVKFPFISILDKNNLIDLELNRNSIRGHLPFIKELVESCELDFLFKLLFYNTPIVNDEIDFSNCKFPYTNNEFILKLGTQQFYTEEIYSTTEGYFLDNNFYSPLIKKLDYYKIFCSYSHGNKIQIIDGAICTLTKFGGTQGERNIIRGDYKSYLTISEPKIYHDHFDSTTITSYVRDRLSIVEETDEYVIFKTANFKENKKKNLIKLFEINKAEAVQLIDKTLTSNDNLARLLKKHFGEPRLIPNDYEEKKKYAKTLSKELQKHIEEKRMIKL